MTRWSADDGRVQVETDKGVYEAKELVVTAGPWAPLLLADLGMPLRVARVAQFWFEAPERFREEAGMPCFAFDVDGAFVYGFPSLGGRMKLADHRARVQVASAEGVDRAVHPDEAATISPLRADKRRPSPREREDLPLHDDAR